MVQCKSFLSFYSFWVQKSKNQIFEENTGFASSFVFELKYRWFQIRLADMKNTKPLNFRLLIIFYDLSKKAHFHIFRFFFENNQVHILKSL